MLQVARIEYGAGSRWAVVDGEELVLLDGAECTTGELVTRGADAIAAAARSGGPRVPLASTTLLSPITGNQQLVCQGANYRQHMIEAGLDPDRKRYNMFFRKASSCLSGARDDIRRPAHVELLDYEVELGLVLGRDLPDPQEFDEDTLPDAVAAVVIHNDVSARDVQIPEMQFYKGKSYRTFGPTGPYLTFVDDSLRSAWADLRLELRVNGEVRQADHVRNMVYPPGSTLTEMTSLQSLSAGDLIATGTPSGVALRLPAPWLVRLLQVVPEHLRWPMFIRRQKRSGRYLEDGDVVECSIFADDGRVHLGKLTNRVVAAG